MIYYYLGCAVLGIVAGFLVGASASPVVGVVLPLLFTLLGSSGGIIAAVYSRAEGAAERQFKLIGISALAFSVPFLAATLHGMSVRTGTPIADVALGVANAAPPHETAALRSAHAAPLTESELLNLYLLAHSAKLSGLASHDVAHLVDRMVTARSAEAARYRQNRPAIIATAEDLRSAIEPVADADDDSVLMSIHFKIDRFLLESAGEDMTDTEYETAIDLRDAVADATESYSSSLEHFTGDGALAEHGHKVLKIFPAGVEALSDPAAFKPLITANEAAIASLPTITGRGLASID